MFPGYSLFVHESAPSNGLYCVGHKREMISHSLLLCREEAILVQLKIVI